MPPFDPGDSCIERGTSIPQDVRRPRHQVEERFYLLAPALILLVILLTSFLVYLGLCAIGKPPDMGRVKHNQFFGHFMARFLVWVIQPVEKLLVSTKVSPNTITAVSLVMCAA